MALYEYALVYIVRNRVGRVKGRSFQRFETRTDLEVFLEYSRDNLKEFLNLEIHQVSIRDASPPEGKPNRRGDVWCPYCAEWGPFNRHDDGYKKCDICCITDAEYYVKKYNNLEG